MAEMYKTLPNISMDVPCLAIPDVIAERTGLKLAWAGESKFGVHAFDSTMIKGQDRRSQHAPCIDKVFDTRLTSILFHPVSRKLVTESNDYFAFAQKLAGRQRNTEFPLEVLRVSRQYRCLLQASYLELKNAAELSKSQIERDSNLKLIPVFYNMEVAWHLCEILFMDALPGHLVLTQLVTWIRYHVPYVEKEVRKLLALEPDRAEHEDNYWRVVIDCLLQRRIEMARSLLQLHSKYNTEPFQRMDQMLRTMPVFDVHGGLSGTEFQVRHECWRKEAARLQRTGHFSVDPHLDIIGKIIVGDDSVQDLLKRHCDSWYQHMVANLIYCSPAVKVFDLAFHANRSLALYTGPEQSNTFNWVLCAIMEMDIYKMVDRAQNWNDSDWLLTHLIHLMHILGKLNVAGPADVGGQLCESILLSYGSLMLSHPSLWQIGVDYLDACPTEGKGRLSALLSRVPFKTNIKALKISQIAMERGLNCVVYTVAKVQGLRCQARGHLGSALSWAMRSQDPVFCSQLADEFLKGYMKTQQFECLDLLENLGCEMMLGDRLIFLEKYCEFLRMKMSGDLQDAAALFVQLLKNKLAPKYFWMTMFNDVKPLLEHKMPVFSTPDVMESMLSLQELIDSADESDLELPKESIISIQNALAQCLAHIVLLAAFFSSPFRKMAIGDYPIEYDAKKHGPYDPARYYGKPDTAFSQLKIGEVGPWLARRNKSPQAIAAAISRSFWRWQHAYLHPRKAGLAGPLQLIVASSLFFYCINYGKLKHHRNYKYH